VPVDPIPAPDPDIEIVTGPPEPETETTVRSPRTARMIVVAVVLSAFLLGLLFPRGDRGDQAEPIGRRISQDVRVDTAARMGGTTLRLVRLNQAGEEFAADFVTGDGFPPPGTITGAAVEMRTHVSGAAFTNFGVSDQVLIPRADGFTIRGTIPDGRQRIVELRVTTIQVRMRETPTWSVDITTVWPVGGAGPKLLRVGSSRSAGSGSSLRLVAILAWQSRLEAVFELRGSLRAGEFGPATIDGIEMSMSGEGDGLQDSWTTTLAAVQQEQISPGEVLARFEGVPNTARRVRIRATRVSRFLAGPWSWRIA
jgi:hypothetical protein